jgi:hypothetical protein
VYIRTGAGIIELESTLWEILIHFVKRVSKSSQLGTALGLLQDRLHLGRLHDVALDLQLAAHEQTLGIGLAGNELGEIGVGEGEGDCRDKENQYM